MDITNIKIITENDDQLIITNFTKNTEK